MVSFRFASLLTLASFGLLACAKPIAVAPSAVARASESGLATRGDISARCGCSEDIIGVLVQLKIDVEVQVALLDGDRNCEDPVLAIIAAIDAAVVVLAKVDLTVGLIAADITVIVGLIVDIVVAICVGLGKYGVDVIAVILVKLNVCITAFINVFLALHLDILVALRVALQVHVDLVVLVKLQICLFLGIQL